jgi:hypothetical protein
MRHTRLFRADQPDALDDMRQRVQLLNSEVNGLIHRQTPSYHTSTRHYDAVRFFWVLPPSPLCRYNFAVALRSQSKNIFNWKRLSGFALMSRRKVCAKLSWSRDVKRSTSLNHRQENRLDMGVCSRMMKEPSGTSADRQWLC